MNLSALSHIMRLAATREGLEKNELLYETGDPATALYCIEDGVVAQEYYHLTGEALHRPYFPGMVLGIDAFGSDSRHESARALRHSNVLVMPYKELSYDIQRHPDLYKRMLGVIGTQIALQGHLHKDQCHESARERIAQQLLIWSHWLETDTWPATIANLGSIAGSSKKTAVRVTTELEDEDLIDKPKGIRITDTDTLASRYGNDTYEKAKQLKQQATTFLEEFYKVATLE